MSDVDPARIPLVELERNRKYQSADGKLLVVKESGQVGKFVLKNAWVLRDWKGYYITHSADLKELARLNNLEL